jgi:hypothetical protein
VNRETPRSGGAAGMSAEEVAALAAKLREVCVLMLVYGEPGPELAVWCLRMLVEPGVVERTVEAVERAVGPSGPL